MKPLLALSTSWCSSRHTDGYAMLKEMAELGFEYVELSHGIRVALVPGVLRAVEEGIVRVSSVHNFCPLPAGIQHAAPNLFMPSETNYRQHEEWLRNTKRTIDFAHQMAAQVMVLHLGAVNFFLFNPADKIRAYRQQHPTANVGEDPAYKELLGKSYQKLRKRMPPFWDRVKASIEEILPYAEQKGVRLGFENREKFDELPLDVDFPDFLRSVSKPHVGGYWHDTGHAALKAEMGLISHKQQLEDNADRIFGFHLHDVDEEGHDHQPIGHGKIDFAMVSKFWRPHHLLTIELSPHAQRDEVLETKAKLEALIATVPQEA